MTNVDDRLETGPVTDVAEVSVPAMEEFLCEAWRELLGASGEVAESDFFALGGHSFLAIEVISRLQESFKVEIPFWTIFECPTPRLLAQRVAQSESQ